MAKQSGRKIVRLTPARRNKHETERLRAIYANGVIIWDVFVGGEFVPEADAGLEIGDIEHIFDTGRVIAQRAVESYRLGGVRVTEYRLGGLATNGYPAEITMEVLPGKQGGAITAFRWFQGRE